QAHEDLSSIRACALVETARHACLPMRRPLRGQADSFVVVRTGEIKEIVVHPYAQLMLRLTPQGKQASVRLRTRRIEDQSLLKLQLGFLRVISCPQRARVGCA